jgi:TetR/AcrR family transcriptional repressor of uid operon
MENIGQEAGLSPTVAFRYFDSKEDIILATIQDSLNRMKRFYETEFDEKDAQQSLQMIVDDQIQRFEQPGREIYYRIRVQLWAEELQNPEVGARARSLREEGLDQFAAVIKMGQERGQIDPNLDAMAVSIAFAANHDGFVLHWLADPDVDVQRYRTVLMAMVQGLFNYQG